MNKEEQKTDESAQLVSSILCTNASENLKKQVVQELAAPDPEEVSEELNAVIASACVVSNVCREN